MYADDKDPNANPAGDDPVAEDPAADRPLNRAERRALKHHRKNETPHAHERAHPKGTKGHHTGRVHRRKAV